MPALPAHPAPDPLRGFILQATYRLEAGRPVVHLWGRAEDGSTFLVRDGRQVPCFYVAARDAARVVGLGGPAPRPCDLATMRGEPVARLDLVRPADAPPLRDRLLAAGIACYEADVRFAVRYLIEGGLRGALAVRGPWRPGDGVDRVFDEPRLEPAEWSPRLAVLSLDIETDPQARRLLSVALVGCGASEVLLLTPPGYTCPPTAIPCASERELLAAFCRRVRELDPDVLTGWNLVGFDLTVLDRLARRLGVPLELGRGAGGLRLRPARGGWAGTEATLAGRLVLDGVDLLRGAFVRMESYALDAVAREVLGEGKTMGGEGGDRAAEILHAFRHERERFVAYNRNDARLVLDILARLQLVELAVERSRLTGMQPDRVASSVAAFDFLYLSRLHRRGRVAPGVGSRPGDGAPAGGGHVIRPRPGLYPNVLALDFKSLYPSLIRTFEIDPLGLLEEGEEAEGGAIVAPNGARFRRRPGILSAILDELMPRREEAKRRGDQVASHAIKILMNSFYGVLGTPLCRFYDSRLANAITSFGRQILLWSKRRVEELGHEVLYGDTDSLFVASGCAEAAAARVLGSELARRVTADLAAHLRATWGVESRLELELETVFLRLFLLSTRHGGGGASKRYAGLVEEAGERRVVLTGLEAVRRDTTELARRVQREVYERFFLDRPVDGYLRQVVVELRAGRLDGELTYRRALRKRPEEYTATTPPHVAAARKASRRGRGTIAYVMTRSGPEPAAGREHPFDYEHYVEKQIEPVVEPVLAALGLDFRRVIGDEHQLTLFPS